jgi:pimeloyl-ACP methyl ester carboxylesterase
MELNSLFFPAPEPSYTPNDFPQNLMWIPRYKNPVGPAIPCLVLPFYRKSSKIILYFHGNAEDVNLTYDLLDHMRNCLFVNVIAVEYPGYGLYSGKPSASQLIEDADCVFTFLTDYLDISPKDILVFGRSIGTGPATWLAANYLPGALILLSPYTSLRAVVKHVAGKLAQYLVAERFRNIELFPSVSCPTFILHGQQDGLIPCSQAQELRQRCGGPCTLISPRDMDHNEFDYLHDLLVPLGAFLMQHDISVQPESCTKSLLTIPAGLLIPPPSQLVNEDVINFSSLM